MSFQEKFASASTRNQSMLCVGLDPQPDRLPISDVRAFCRAIIHATEDLVCAYKPQAAFFEALGPDGWQILQDVIADVPAEIPVLLDAKRGDVPHTAQAYADACFDVLGADAVTVNPYLGADAVHPFLARPDRTAFILCRTSNAGAPDIQDLLVDGEPLYLRVAALAREWSAPHNNAGLVVGATYPSELAAVRKRCPRMPLLLPGVGAQQGDLRAAVQAGLDADGGGILVGASRSVLYASSGSDFAGAARAEAQRLRDAINAACPAPRAESG